MSSKLKTIALLISCLLLFGCTSLQTIPSNITLLNQTLNSVVTIQSTTNKSEVRFTYVSNLSPPDAIISLPGLWTIGAGSILDRDGYIVTNAHVVNNEDTIYVKLSNGLSIKALVIGIDPDTDVALLKIPSKFVNGIVPIRFADSDKVLIGQQVYAIGNPRRLGISVSQGIVSALHRQAYGVTRFEDYIQTDAAVNPGNSGGPLIDYSGRMVGMNTIMISGEIGNVGLNFAIPSNLIKNVINRIKQHGHAPRVHLGFKVTDFQTPSGNGILVLKSKNPLIQQHDYITHVNGKRIITAHDFKFAVSFLENKNPVSITILRVGTEYTIKVIPY